jgi:HD-GYP domain-containing protein (c-di-GMP phosphodiesterase class II)
MGKPDCRNIAPNGVPTDTVGAGGVAPYAEDASLNRMLANVVNEVKKFAESQASQIRRLNDIGVALSAEQNLDLLLEKILDEARAFSTADGGTLYMVNNDNDCLEFAIIQNDTMNIRMGGTRGAITWAPLPLHIDGAPNFSNVSSYVAITGKTVNIPDLYQTEEFDFSGPRRFDEANGYRSASMLVIPMRNKANEIIGVLQLINAIDPVSRAPIPFFENDVALIASLASQAAVAITNVRLYEELEKLFESFIVTIATAIDEKSPYTAGHIRRVQQLTMSIARRMHDRKEGHFKEFSLTGDQFNELRIAAWLHDVGKIITPEYVVDKTTKLETILDGSNLIAARYELFRRDARISALESKLRLFEAGAATPEKLALIDEEYRQKDASLLEERDFIMQCNKPGEFMDNCKIERLKGIAGMENQSSGVDLPRLTDRELYNLSIVKGSLTPEEREIIENHALVTMKMLKCLPFPGRLKHVPEFAAYHHEKLDGTGYPFKLKGDQLSRQTRIIAIADIFEALTARDRPYKKPMTVSRALEIMDLMKNDGHIDAEIFDLFVGEKIYLEYARQELDPSQIDR